MIACERRCRLEDREGDDCCYFPCALYVLGVLYEDSESSGKYNVNPKGLENSFMMSVGNDSAWLPVVQSSTQRCYEDNLGSVEGFECNIIPL